AACPVAPAAPPAAETDRRDLEARPSEGSILHRHPRRLAACMPACSITTVDSVQCDSPRPSGAAGTVDGSACAGERTTMAVRRAVKAVVELDDEAIPAWQRQSMDRSL